MQQMFAQAKKIERELKKAHAELAEKEFVIKKAGIVEITLTGDKKVKTIKIEKDAITPANEEMIEDTLALAINEGLEAIKEANDAIEEQITGQKGSIGY